MLLRMNTITSWYVRKDVMLTYVHISFFSLCRGKSLFNLVHVRKEKFPMNKTIIIAQQVAQVNMSRDTRNSVFGSSDRVRHKLLCTYSEKG